jgi:putative ABC transport system permease protein
MGIDKDFMSFFKMQLTAGAGFNGTKADSMHFILNEAAVKEIGLTNPIGKRFKLWNTNGTIIGVVKDFHFASMKEKIGPAVFYSRILASRPDVYQDRRKGPGENHCRCPGSVQTI